MANVVRFAPTLESLDNHIIFDDFWADQSDLFFLDTPTDGGSAAVGDAANGIMTVTTTNDNTDNDETYLESANETFLIAAGRSLYFRTRIQFTEASTNAANVAVGFASAVAADLLVDNGAGLRTSGNIVSIYKVDGGTVWRCNSRNGSGTTDTASTTTAGGASYQVLEIDVTDWDGTNVVCTFKVDGVALRDSNNVVIRHTLAISGSTEMAAFVALKNGTTADETVLVDYIYAAQTR